MSTATKAARQAVPAAAAAALAALDARIALDAAHLIGDDFVRGDATELVLEDPATGTPWLDYCAAGEALVGRAVDSAASAFPGWAATPPDERGRVLRAFAAALRAHGEPLAVLESFTAGKPIRDARVEIGLIAGRSSTSPDGRTSSQATPAG